MKTAFRSNDYRELRLQFAVSELKRSDLCVGEVRLFGKHPIGMSDVRCGIEFVAVECIDSSLSYGPPNL